jgi:hypothetical protein
VACFIAGITVAGWVSAASIFEFDRWMQRIERHALSVQKHIARGDSVASAADAREIEELYRLMQGYFEDAGNAAQAVEMSRQGREAAAAVATHVMKGDFAAATAAVKSITRECRTCHRAYKPL